MSSSIPEQVNTSVALINKVDYLLDRSHMLQRARSFFDERGVVEVDCPLIGQGAVIDTHIDLFATDGRYLHSSPEYFMKRLLALGMPDIYQLSHVFRKGEVGALHNPEFMMAEWYRQNFSFDKMIEETIDFVSLFFPTGTPTHLTYREAFLLYSGIDPNTIKDDDTLMEIQVTQIEPHFKNKGLIVFKHYPKTQAACAAILSTGEALRFELYFQGVELANGYCELSDANEQRRRFEISNQERMALGKETLPIDERFLEACAQLPPCCGVAVGFDRLMMLRHNLSSIAPIISFSWQES